MKNLLIMHIISKRPFTDAVKKYPNDQIAIMEVYKILKKGTFVTPAELKKIYNSLDNFKYKDKWYIIDIGGNNLRLIMQIQFSIKKIYVKHIVTHSEYNKICKKYR